MLLPGRDPRVKRAIKTETSVDYFKKSAGVSVFFGYIQSRLNNRLNTTKSTLLSRWAILVVAFLLIPGSVLLAVFNSQTKAYAAPSTYLNFQARLNTSAGSLVPDGYYNVEFKLFDASSSSGSSQGSCTGDANCKWVETYYDSNGVTAGNDNRIRVTNGYFSVKLGSLTAFSGINWDQQMWLTMNIGGSTQTATPTYDGEMTPRIQLTAVPLAFVANNVNSGSTTAASTPSANTVIQSGSTTGATSNSGTVTLQSGNVTSGNSGNITIDAGTASGTKGAITLGATNASALTLGRSGLTTSNAGALTVAQLLTGQAGLTISGAVVSINDTSNFAVNISTGTTNTLTTIGGGSGTFSLQTSNIDISSAGAITNATGLASSGSITFSGLSTAGIVTNTSGGLLGTTATVPVANGGTALATTPTNGQLLVGNGTNYTLATIGGTGITVTNGSGTISIATIYGSASNTAAQGNITFTCPSGTGNLSGGGTTITIGSGGTCSNLTVINNPTFSGLITGQAGLTVTNGGALVTQRGSDNSTTGSLNDLNFGTSSLVRFTGVSTQTLTGLANGTDGRILTIVNAASQAMVITNDDATSTTAANRIFTGTGTSVSLGVGSSVTLVYDSGASRWRVIGDVAGGTGIAVTTLAAIGSTPNANGASISGSALTLQPADGSFGGVVTATTQTFAGAKTFNNEVILSTVSGAGLTSCSNSTTSKLLYDSTAKTYSCGTDQGILSTLVDNTTNALDIQQSTFDYINIDTTDTAEKISFGNTTTNPNYNFLGSGSFTVKGASINLGTIDTGPGDNTLNLYGGGTAVNEGGQIALFTSADFDTTIDNYIIDAYQDDLRIHSNGTVRMTIDQSGNTTFNGNLDVAGTLFAGTSDAFQVSSIGGITAVGVNSGSGIIQGTGGLTVSGANVSLNNSSNFTVGIATGTNNTLTTIGGGSGTFSLQTLNIDISSTGAISNATGVSSSGSITFSGLSTAGIVTNTSGGLLGTTTSVSAVLGGTGQTVYAIGDILAADTTTSLSKVAAVATGSCLISQGVTTLPIWGSCAGGAELIQVPGSTAQNTITPTAASVVGLTVNGTSNATGATSLIVNQVNTTASGAAINLTNTSGTQTDGLLVNRNTAGGTTTNLLNLTNTAGTATNALSINGTYTNLINSTNLTVTNVGNADFAGTLTAGTANAFTVSAAGAILGVGVNSGTGLIQGTGGLTITGTASLAATTISSTLAVTGNANFDGNLTVGNATSDTVTFTGRVSSDILPSADDTYNLGSSTLRWQDMYVGPTSLHVYCNAAECTGARDWTLGVIEAGGASEGNIRLGLAGASTLVVSTAGNVGIGTDTPSSGKLHVVDSSATNSTGLFVLSSTSSASGNSSIGLDVYASTTASNSTANVIGVRSMATSADSVNSGNSYAFYAQNSTAITPTSGVQYGVYVEDMTTAPTNYALYTAGTASSYLGGRLGLGTTAGTGVGNSTQLVKALNSRTTVGSYPTTALVGNLFETNFTAADSDTDHRANTYIDTSYNFAGTLQNQRGLMVQTRVGNTTTGSTVTDQYGLWLRNDVSASSTVTNSYGMYLNFSNAGTVTNGTALYIADVPGSTFQIGINQVSYDDSNYLSGFTNIAMKGTVTTNGVCHSGADTDVALGNEVRTLVACSATANDYAEMYPTEIGVTAGDIVATSSNLLTYEASGANAETGEVFSMGQKQISILKKASSTDSLMGIISTAPQETIGRDIPVSANRKPLALSGRVPVKVNNEGGAISIGDKITISSVSGVGKKATSAGYVVGTALEPFNGTSGVIYVFVSNSYYAPTISSILQGSSLSVSGNSVLNGSVQIGSSLNVSGPTTLSSLTVTGNVVIQANLTVQGDTSVQNITVNGKIISSGSLPDVELGQVLSSVLGASIINSGTDTAGSVEVVSGTQASISGEIAEITFTQAYASAPKIVISGNNAKSAKIGAYIVRTQSGFKIVVDDPLELNQSYSFDYIVIEAVN